MKKYALIDIGSNTIVLVIYEIDGQDYKIIKYKSNPVHLVSYIKDEKMSQEGIDRAIQAINAYIEIAKEYGIDHVYGDITAPARGIDNQEEVLKAFCSTGLDLSLLQGEEEALLSYYGTSWDRTISQGIMIDIGGGSTEVLYFKDDKPITSFSMPLGCVRLKQEEDPLDASRRMLAQYLQTNPDMPKEEENLLGVGGTVRAAMKVIQKIHGKAHSFGVDSIYELYEKLMDEDPMYLEAVKEKVNKDRQAVFVYGVAMIQAICEAFHIQRLYSSEYGVREGFLLKHILMKD